MRALPFSKFLFVRAEIINHYIKSGFDWKKKVLRGISEASSGTTALGEHTLAQKGSETAKLSIPQVC